MINTMSQNQLNNLSDSSATTISRPAAQLSFVTASLFLVLLAALHILKPDLDPSWHMISEYEIGQYGWVMILTFLSLAASCVSLAVAIWSQVRSIGGRIGLVLLLLSALGMTIAAIFISDPITAGPSELTTHGKLHGLGALLGIPTFPIAALLINLYLARKNSAWSAARNSLLWTAGLPLLGLVVFASAMALTFRGSFGPETPIGWPNRFLIITQCVWLMAVAWRADRLSKQR